MLYNCNSLDVQLYFPKLKHYTPQLYTAHEGAAHSLTFHPSGNFLASGAADGKVAAWQNWQLGKTGSLAKLAA